MDPSLMLPRAEAPPPNAPLLPTCAEYRGPTPEGGQWVLLEPGLGAERVLGGLGSWAGLATYPCMSLLKSLGLSFPIWTTKRLDLEVSATHFPSEDRTVGADQ